MPVLERRATDGEYYVRHFFHEHSTWQILGEGVRLLANRGINEGSRFSTDLFMDLWMSGLVYHGLVPVRSSRPCRDPIVSDSLRSRVAEFFGLLYARNAARAWPIVAAPIIQDDGESSDVMYSRFVREVEGLQIQRWRQADSQVHDIEYSVEVDGCRTFHATRLAAVLIRLRLGSSVTDERDLRQHWVYADGKWWVIWRQIRLS
jgi:hypothetical protein